MAKKNNEEPLADAVEAVREITPDEFAQDVSTVRHAGLNLIQAAWDTCETVGPVVTKYDELSGGAARRHDPTRPYSLRRLAEESGMPVATLRAYGAVYREAQRLPSEVRQKLPFTSVVALLKAPEEDRATLAEEAVEQQLSSRALAKAIQDRYRPGPGPDTEEEGSSGTAQDEVQDAEVIEPPGTGRVDLAHSLSNIERFLDGVLDGEDLTDAGLGLLAEGEFMTAILSRLADVRKRVGFLSGALSLARTRQTGMRMNG